MTQTTWYNPVPSVQKIINSTKSDTTPFSPFELMVGVKNKNKNDIQIKQLIEEEHAKLALHNKNELQEIA